MRKFCCISYKLIADQGLIVGKGDPDISFFPILLRDPHQLFRRERFRIGSLSKRFLPPGDRVVLAERTAKVTSVASDGDDVRAREEPPKRLFLDRVECERSDPAVI